MPIRTLLVHPAHAGPRDKQLELSLSLEGLEVAVTRASDALGSAVTLRPHLIVIDADVGDAVSAELTGGLRETSQTASTPIVLLTEEQYRAGNAESVPRESDASSSGGWEPYLLHGLRIVPVPRQAALQWDAGLPPGVGAPPDTCDLEALVLTLVSAALLVDFRLAGTIPHLERVARVAVAIHEHDPARAADRRGLVLAAFLHDLGKVTLRPGILDQQAPLRLKDWFRIYTHPLETMTLLAPLPFLRCAIPAVRSLHERWDGTGYPDGLAESRIPASARLIGMCEAYDAMRRPRPWRPALSADEARAELRRGGGSQFDPELVDAFLEIEAGIGPVERSAWDQPSVRGLFDRMSPRAWQVLSLCAAGADVPTCSSLLGINRDQIGNYRGRLRRQLGLPPRHDVRDAVREHIYPRITPAGRAMAALLEET